MNWFKLSLTQDTAQYFQDIDESGQYVPDKEKANDEVWRRTQSTIVNSIGCGDSGCAYLLSNGDVLKITSNSSEASMSMAIMKNPHPNIASFKDVWKEGNLWYIIMSHVESTGSLSSVLSPIENALDKSRCYSPKCAVGVVSKMPNFNYKDQILSYLNHLVRLGLSPFDFINSNNAGLSGGKIVFFDLT